jgi:signal peptidase I
MMAGLAGINIALSGQIAGLPFALIPLIAGIGIVRGRVWSAYGFAVFEFGQILLVPLILLRRGGHLTGVGAIIVLVVVGTFFAFAGRSMAAAGLERGRAWPWIAVTSLTALGLFFVQPFVIPTPAMEDTLLVGDQILVRCFPKPRPERGDMIVFVFPVDRSERYVKRVIGVPGDRIHILNKVVYLNGKPLEETYAKHVFPKMEPYRDTFPAAPYGLLSDRARKMLAENVINGEVVVPEGSYFAMGDNRDNSLDSRYWGFVGTGDLIGKPLLIYGSTDQSTGQFLNRRPLSWPIPVRWNRLFRFL